MGPEDVKLPALPTRTGNMGGPVGIRTEHRVWARRPDIGSIVQRQSITSLGGYYREGLANV